MDSIEQHIKTDKEILDNPMTSPQKRRHVEEELHELEVYAENHKKEIEQGDHHDPTALELYCEVEPGAPECKIHDN
nr:CP12 [uncultured Mediterranean phage uvMED]BAR25577.1 CP12 [uncultured Mediterranean phage uvMED]|tara:strand:+ start:9933 stop:10160 length:228 start_codon:yes stop_codon:yes gene_type:complete